MNTKYMQHKNVLVIEDETSLREIFCLVLELEGYHVKGVNNGQEALSYLLSLSGDEYPDAIMLDLMMPIMDGNTFLQKISNFPGLSKIPVIICSGHGEFEKTSQVICNLEKPVELSKLCQAFNDLLNLKHYGMIHEA